jgi:hypothetical protein
LQDKEVECTVRDSELRDLKEEVTRLSSLVSRLGMAKAQQVNSRNPQVSIWLAGWFHVLLLLDLLSLNCTKEALIS